MATKWMTNTIEMERLREAGIDGSVINNYLNTKIKFLFKNVNFIDCRF